MNKEIYDNYVKILHSELIPAMGCTEPIAVAYAAAKAREILGKLPERIIARCSGNIVKNVKSVIVPNSDNERGIEAAAILGAVSGRADIGLQVISEVTESEIQQAKALLDQNICTCELAEGEDNLYILITVFAGEDMASVEVRTKHDHISRITRNGQVLLEQDAIEVDKCGNKDLLTVHDIIEFANTVDLEDVQDLIERQIEYNSAISREGLSGQWGAGVGKTILEFEGTSVLHRARAAAAAGSDARMNGCALPVVINSGSGNQGITICMPIVVYAEELGCSHEKLLRALVLANLISCHQKRFIGNLSSYCGAVSAGTAAACGVAYMKGASDEVIGYTIINSVATIGGILCDGAKSSCAAKISSAVQCGILSYEMANRGRHFEFGEGIVEDDVEQTIRNIGYVGKEGMRDTDVTILNIMLHKIDC